MTDLFPSLGRAVLSQLHPRMLWMTVLPFLLASVVWGGLLYFTWDPVMTAARGFLETSVLTSWIYGALDWFGLASLRALVAPLIVVALMVPLVVITLLVGIGVFSVPSVIRFLDRSYPELEKKQGASFMASALNSLGCTLIALFVGVITIPLWLIPPFFALIPPLLWGWLTYRVMSYDALALHASVEERKVIMRQHRLSLIVMGVAMGILGAAPTLLWVSSVAVIFLFPFVLLVSVWMYVLIFIFSALWFGHYCLRALTRLRAAQAAPAAGTIIEMERPAVITHERP
jgi:hypothetical protein